jgi:hypothetical protein
MEELARVFGIVTSPADQALLNSMILTSRVADAIPRPGSVYLRRDWPKPPAGQSTPFDMLPGNAKALTKELFDPYLDETVKKSLAEAKVVQGQKAASGARADAQIQANTLMAKLEGTYEEALVEFTPICDFAQSKQVMVRLVRGFFIPQEFAHLVKQAPFLHKIGPIFVPGLDGVRHLVLNARYVNGFAPSVFGLHPAMRLRQQLMAALQAWFASHAGRPGYLFIDR